MATIANVERSIRRVEGFEVRFRFQGPGGATGRDVRGDRTSVATYEYERAANDDWTVAEWREKRFRSSYPGFTVEVLDAHGYDVHGRTKLRTVRSTY